MKREEEEVFLLAGTCAHRPLLVTRKKGLDPQEGTKKEKRRGSVQSGKWRQCAADRQRPRMLGGRSILVTFPRVVDESKTDL